MNSNILRKIISLSILTGVATATSRPAGTQPAVSTTAETDLRAADAAFAKAAAARDVEGCVSFYADDARVLQADQPLVAGRVAIRKSFERSFSDSAFTVSWRIEKLEVSSAGDLAYSTGRAHFTMSGPHQNTLARQTRFATVWKQAAEGKWKIELDADVEVAPAEPVTRRDSQE